MGVAVEQLKTQLISLSPSERFHHDGYLIVEGLFDSEEVDLLGQIARADHELASRAGKSPGWRRGRHPSFPAKHALRRHLQRLRTMPPDR